jgi:hypothetical protein
LPYETWCKTGRTSAKVRATKSRRNFHNERPRSTPLDPKLTFWCVRTIWVHSGLFCCLRKPGAKRTELVQKFVPRSRFRIFRNKRTRSTPLDPKLKFWWVSYYLGAFGKFVCLTKLGAKWAEQVQKLVPRSRYGIFRNERTRSTPLDPKLTFWCVHTIWVHSGLFGSLTKLSAKQAELVQKFAPRSRFRIFRNERTRSTLLDPKVHFVLFVCIRDRLVSF